MSDSDDNDPQEVFDPSADLLLEIASNSSGGRRKSLRLAEQHPGSRTDEADMLIAQLRDQGITPAPGLLPAQLRDLADYVSLQPGPSSVPSNPADFSAAPARGRKRTRKAAPSKAPTAKISNPPARPRAPAPIPAPGDMLTTTLQSLASTLQNIDNRLETLENAAHFASSSNTSAPQFSLAQTATHTLSLPSENPQHTLASAVPAPGIGRPYIPQAANISARLRSKILQGKDINLVSLILPSPECDKTIAAGENLTAVFKTTDPRLIRDLSIGQFLIAFSIFRDTICSVYPRTETGIRRILGFHVGVPSSPTVTYVAKNLQSAIKEPGIVSQLLEKEVGKGYIIGPFKSSPFAVFRSNPIGIATRKYSGKKRLIFDLSAPRTGPFASINSTIPIERFKIIPVHPSQWNLLGVRWESKFYFAVRLTFGCRSSPSIFNHLSEALCWILLNRVRVPSVLHLLDDFLLVDSPQDSSGASLKKLKCCFQSLGVPLSEEKTIGPDTRLEFLGITLNSIEMKASLPSEKLLRIREIAKTYSDAINITKQQLLSLLGHLNFAMRVIPQGRSFISRLLETATSVPNLHDKISLDEGRRSDLRFWSHLLDHWNGVTFFYEDLVHSSDSIQLFTDAAPSVGFGGFFQGQWFASRWPPSFPTHNLSSALSEIYPIAVACHIWGQHWARKRISVLCDNQTVVNIINKGRSSCKIIMPFMRSITWSAVTHNFIITACHVQGHFNTLADSLSRFNFQTFRRLCPEACSSPIPVPPLHVLSLY
ncbi:uncharacterized protein LOC133012222 [Limanda limanda]|uniref:uncharacterized protein LOC133012222 n=1 Tax=Limanda limanda TaxID=27771 RepID=UPI0029C91EEE|nr:uncharacterized protein LOC133012222 [Limanda limanda]